MSGDHAHTSALTAASRHKRPLLVAFALTAVYTVVEVGVGLAIGSLALVSDAGHMLTDVAGLGMALAAIQVAQSRRSPAATYGLYRLEVLAALANTVLLFGIAAYVLFEAWRRFSDPAEIPGYALLFVASVGLAVNVISFVLLQQGAKESLNVRGASIEVLSDMLGSIGVIVAGIVLLTTGWPYIDPIMGVVIGLFILPRAWRLGREALRILLQVAPADLDVPGVRSGLAALPGVAGVHDLHIWTLTSGLRVATGHLDLEPNADGGAVLARAQTYLIEDLGLEHVTIQVEPAGFQEEKVPV